MVTMSEQASALFGTGFVILLGAAIVAIILSGTAWGRQRSQAVINGMILAMVVAIVLFYGAALVEFAAVSAKHARHPLVLEDQDASR
jgi:Na+/proline symporter